MPPWFADTTTAARLAESADICEGHIAKMRPGMPPQCLRETGAMWHRQQSSSRESAPCPIPLMHMLGPGLPLRRLEGKRRSSEGAAAAEALSAPCDHMSSPVLVEVAHHFP